MEVFGDLFGDIDDISSESDDQSLSPEQYVNEHQMPQDLKEDEPIPVTRIKVEIPSINSDLGRELHFVKLPKFLNIEPKPFDAHYYEDEFANEKDLDEEDKIRLKLKVENTIRWRVRRDAEGKKVKESNTRIVKWSDGSMSMHLGSEVFDIYKAPLQGNYNHLFIREDTGLQGQAVFKSTLTFRPHSKDSSTHRKLALPLARCSKTQKIRILPMADCDPECQRTDMSKREERLRASTHQESQTTHVQKKQSLQGPRTSYLDSDSDDEDDRDQDTVRLAAMKSRYRRNLRRGEPSRKRKAGDEEKEDN